MAIPIGAVDSGFQRELLLIYGFPGRHSPVCRWSELLVGKFQLTSAGCRLAGQRNLFGKIGRGIDVRCILDVEIRQEYDAYLLKASERLTKP